MSAVQVAGELVGHKPAGSVAHAAGQKVAGPKPQQHQQQPKRNTQNKDPKVKRVGGGKKKAQSTTQQMVNYASNAAKTAGRRFGVVLKHPERLHASPLIKKASTARWAAKSAGEAAWEAYNYSLVNPLEAGEAAEAVRVAMRDAERQRQTVSDVLKALNEMAEKKKPVEQQKQQKRKQRRRKQRKL